MATEVGKAFIPVTFDKHQIGRDLSSGIEQGGRGAAGSMRSTFGKLAAIGGGVFAATKAFSFIGDTMKEAREANKVAAQTEAVIKSTGGAAGLTAKDFSSLADSIARKTGIDDEQIQSAENLLATFTNVHDEVGKGNDIFSQATAVAVDMGAALGGDASSNAIALGKALNDPIRGITALRRVGVAFTAEQEEQIKTMVAAGDVMGAQKVILGELTKEFGGSAEAQATAGAKFGVFWGNIKEQIGNFILPLLDRVATWAMDTLPKAFGAVQRAVVPVFRQIRAFFHTLTSGFTEDEGTPVERWALRIRDIVMPIFRTVRETLGAFFYTLKTGFTADEGTPIESFALKLRELWERVLVPFGGWLMEHWKPIVLGVGLAFVAVTAPIATLVAGLIYAYTHFATFRNVVGGVARFVTDNLVPVLAGLGAIILAVVVPAFVAWAVATWAVVAANVALYAPILAVLAAIGLLVGGLVWAYEHWEGFRVVVDVVWQLLQVVAGFVVDTFKNAWEQASVAVDLIKIAFQGFKDLLADLWHNTLEPLVNALQKIIDLAVKAKDALDVILSGGGGGLSGTIDKGLGIIGLAGGGRVPAALGMPLPVIAHGGEYMLSVDMLAGRQPVDVDLSRIRSAVGSIDTSVVSGGGGRTVGPNYITVQSTSPRDVTDAMYRLELLAGVPG